MDKSFKYYLLNEESSHLGNRVSDVLTSAQELQDDMPNMGQRHLTRVAENLANAIRKILHSQWSTSSHKHLKELQKVGVAIQRTIEDKGDLQEIIPAATQALQDLAGKLGSKVNDLKAPPEQEGGDDVTQNDFQLTGNGPEPKAPPQGQPQEQPPQ